MLLFVDPCDGQLKLFGDIGAEGPDGLELGQMDNEIVGLWLSIDTSLEVQNKRYSQVLYLIDYIASRLHLWYEM